MKFLSPDIVLYPYKFTICPCIIYCCHVWAGAPSCYLEIVRQAIVTSRNGNRKIMQSIRIASRHPQRKRRWNQLSQFWRTSIKVMPIEKSYACHISTMSQGFKRSSKWRSNSPAHLFLYFFGAPSRFFISQNSFGSSVSFHG